MPLICSTVENWATETVTEPVENWVSQQQQQCSKKPWPLNWLCWFVTVLVKIIIWVTKQVVVKVTVIVCIFIAWVIGYVFGWIPFIYTWFNSCNIELKEKKEVSSGLFEYTFYCRCNKDCNNKTEVKVIAKDLNEANELAKKECNNIC
jgi:hypothetical protein